MTAPAETHRLALTIHFDGTAYRGWQTQPAERTVQGVLEEALLGLTGERRTILGSGRTDSGVHATGQVASVQLPQRWSTSELQRALNAVLPDDIWIAGCDAVPPDFHPRYHALRRTYSYHLGVSRESSSPFIRRWCWPLGEELDQAALRRAAGQVVGEHSFLAFAKSGQPERGYDCAVEAAEWSPWAELGWTFSITANRYLHHMVRYLVGTMVDIGRGRRPEEDMATLLSPPPSDGGRRLETSPPAPPQGLFLRYVEYPSGVLPDQPGGDRQGGATSTLPWSTIPV